MSNFAPKFTTKMNKTAQHIIDIENVSKRFLSIPATQKQPLTSLTISVGKTLHSPTWRLRVIGWRHRDFPSGSGSSINNFRGI